MNGSPVPENARIQIDHYRQTFTLTIESLDKVSSDTLKNLVQKAFKVSEINKTKDHTIALHVYR